MHPLKSMTKVRYSKLFRSINLPCIFTMESQAQLLATGTQTFENDCVFFLRLSDDEQIVQERIEDQGKASRTGRRLTVIGRGRKRWDVDAVMY